MTHLDIITTMLAEVTGIPAAHFRNRIIQGMGGKSYPELLRELTDEEANRHLEVLRRPENQRGILRWVVEAGVMAHATPAQRTRFEMLTLNMQN